MKPQITLKIKSSGRDDKELILKRGKTIVKKNFSGDALFYIKKILKEEGLEFSDINKILPLKSDSFTGFRESVVIANIFNGIYKKVPLNNLVLAKYHKEPNVHIKS